jgi:YesN/AraC family two-component response regulator
VAREKGMNRTILLVDDEPMVLDILYQLMDKFTEDYDLVAAPNGTAALALLAERSVALVITDQKMPDMDGITLITTIKAAMPQCPVILMTGYPTSELRQRADAAGVDFFVSKPFRLEPFAAVVLTALGH